MGFGSESLEIEQRTLKLQQTASDPTLSVWVTASAGSGKTKILTDRVLRLLLSGAHPDRILCLTFTKAAAAEMSSRIAERLSEWALANDVDLKEDLKKLSGKLIGINDLIWARRLFATVLDSPGGLQVQTIHGFCQSVLRRFPIESGLSPQFAVLDERTARERMRAARDDMILSAKEKPGSGLTNALSEISARASESTLSDLIGDLLSERSKLKTAINLAGGEYELSQLIRKELSVSISDNYTDLINDASLKNDFVIAQLHLAADALMLGSSADVKKACGIQKWLNQSEYNFADYNEYLSVFLTEKGMILKTLATKKVIEQTETVFDTLNSEAKRLFALEQRRKSLDLAIRTEALIKVSHSVLNFYEQAKKNRSIIDYDDLILATRDLLERPGIAPWVLFKLDGGIDHLLIDEAQDTNPEQWQIIEKLTEEFFSQAGVSEVESIATRTVFAVGDIKQSIFSFQRADPQSFLDMRSKFSGRVVGADKGWRGIKLDMSFRSTSAVLNIVDAVFNHERDSNSAGAGVLEYNASNENLPMVHHAHRKGQEGCVELWEPEMPVKGEPKDGWVLPLEQRESDQPRRRLAGKIASKINYWLIEKETLKSKGRPIQPGDIMVLVRRRGQFVHELVRALKEFEIDVAGVDRMMLTDQLPIMDLVAFGQFLLLPEDDLNLAVVLKGPLIGLSEDDLLTICWDRDEKSLWQELSARATGETVYSKAHKFLNNWLSLVDFMPPYELFSEVLCKGGRKNILERLGLEASDPLDEFLTQALEFERAHVPSLQGFLHWLASADFEVKRDMETSQTNQVRILTVHGSKGLQAPIIFLPDTMAADNISPKVFWKETEDGIEIPLWSPNKDSDDGVASLARCEARNKSNKEYRRLLYVAMTRAEDRLYVAGWGTRNNASENSWYKMIELGLSPLAEKRDDKLFFGSSQLGPPDKKGYIEYKKQSAITLPEWALSIPREENSVIRAITPSNVLENNSSSSLFENNGENIYRRGRFIHYLLEWLPRVSVEIRETLARKYLAQPIHTLSASEQTEYVVVVMEILNGAGFKDLFSNRAMTEVPICGNIVEGGKRYKVSGRIDRLLINDDNLIIVDFKTNKTIPRTNKGIPLAYRKQMAIYCKILSGIYPNHYIRCAILWVNEPTLMELPADFLDSVKLFN